MHAWRCILSLLLLATTAAAQSIEIDDERLPEISGVVASARHPGHCYVHNDSRNRPEVYLLAPDGRIAATIRLLRAVNRDWEDIALAPGQGDAFDVCVAEIGDNRSRMPRVSVYRFPEPKLPDQAGEVIPIRPLRYDLKFPDKPQNAEAFVVDPQTGDGYIFTKRSDGTTRMYRLPAPWKADEVNRLELLQTLKLELGGTPGSITAADFRPDGTHVVLRNYVAAWEYQVDRPRTASQSSSQPGGATKRAAPLQLVPLQQTIHLPRERQGEAIAYTRDGQSVYSISERLPTYLYRIPIPK